jgi:hypothetical protein
VLANVRPSGARSILWNFLDNTWSYVGDQSADVRPVALTNDGCALGVLRGNGVLAVICNPGGDWEPLGTPIGWDPRDINDRGDTVGALSQVGLSRPWLRLATGEQLLLPYVIGHNTDTTAVNNAGNIVGTAHADHGGHAVIWRRN